MNWSFRPSKGRMTFSGPQYSVLSPRVQESYRGVPKVLLYSSEIECAAYKDKQIDHAAISRYGPSPPMLSYHAFPSVVGDI